MNAESKVAIITGASQGIGAGLVHGFRERGYRVVANSRSIKPDAFGDPDVLAVAGDIANSRTAGRVVAAAVERFGRVETLVNNAGQFLSRPFLSQRAAARMLEQGRGHIVNITTSLVDQPLAGVPAAMAALTKGGLDAVTRSLAIEYAGRGIRVNAVSPGIIKTPMHPAESHEFFAQLHPVGRMGEVREVVDAVLYLESAAFVTGEVLHVDGGQHAGRW
jgi:NAD(P)-dependent dehydrogenase (short-subunit alcohol dehydrogenase family)